MPNISWMLWIWSTCDNTSSPILQLLKTVCQRFTNTIPNNTRLSKNRLNYLPVYVYKVLQTTKGLILLRILMPHPTFCLTLCKWFLQVRNWSIVRPRHFVVSTCCKVKPFTLNEMFPSNVATICRLRTYHHKTCFKISRENDLVPFSLDNIQCQFIWAEAIKNSIKVVAHFSLNENDKLYKRIVYYQGASTAPLFKTLMFAGFHNQPPLPTMPGLVFSSFLCSENPSISAGVWYEAFYQKCEPNLLLLYDSLFLLWQTRVLTICLFVSNR